MDYPDADLTNELRTSLCAAASVMAAARDRWWIIAGAAAALHGASPSAVADVDVLLSQSDAERLLPVLGLQLRPGPPSHRFRSDVFATWTSKPLPIEFMANFFRFDGTGWHRVEPATRQSMMVAGCEVFLPTRSELIEMLLSFGRPKDVARARALGALGHVSRSAP